MTCSRRWRPEGCGGTTSQGRWGGREAGGGGRDAGTQGGREAGKQGGRGWYLPGDYQGLSTLIEGRSHSDNTRLSVNSTAGREGKGRLVFRERRK